MRKFILDALFIIGVTIFGIILALFVLFLGLVFWPDGYTACLPIL